MDSKTIRDFLRPGGYITLNKILCKKLGITCTFILSDLINRHNDFNKKEFDKQNGFSYSENDRVTNNQITPFQQRKYINILKSLGLLGTQLKEIPSKLYFYINFELIYEFIGYEEDIQQWIQEKYVIEYKNQWRPKDITKPKSWDSNSTSCWIDLCDFFNLDLLTILQGIAEKYEGQAAHDLLLNKKLNSTPDLTNLIFNP